MKPGDKIKVSNDGHGNPILEFNRKTRQYGPGLQTFEVTRLNPDGSISLKPVWPLNPRK